MSESLDRMMSMGAEFGKHQAKLLARLAKQGVDVNAHLGITVAAESQSSVDVKLGKRAMRARGSMPTPKMGRR